MKEGLNRDERRKANLKKKERKRIKRIFGNLRTNNVDCYYYQINK